MRYEHVYTLFQLDCFLKTHDYLTTVTCHQIQLMKTDQAVAWIKANKLNRSDALAFQDDNLLTDNVHFSLNLKFLTSCPIAFTNGQ
jgi:hypothetical protein